MASRKFEHAYAIVEFNKSKGDILKPIDLVPGLWMTRINDKVVCSYPPKNEFSLVSQWVKEAKSPHKSWKQYAVKVISIADDYEQGLRRLDRAFKTRECVSSDETTLKSKSMIKLPPKINEKKLKNILQKTISLNKTSSLNAKYQQKDQDRNNNSPEKNMELLNNASKKDDETESESESEINRSSTSGNTVGGFSFVASDDERDDVQEDSPQKETPSPRSQAKNENENLIGRFEDLLDSKLDSKLQTLQKFLEKQIERAKLSILYDINEKMQELKVNVTANNLPRVTPGILAELATEIETPLPIENLEEFLRFEDELVRNRAKENSLGTLLQVLCGDHKTVKACIEQVLPRIMRKAVQGHYSGQGRKRNGVAKLDFSSTKTFECFQTAIFIKFDSQTDDVKKLKSNVGLWLAHWQDREQGRAVR